MTAAVGLNDELTRKVMRAAREPSRVFASSDTRTNRLPLAHIAADGRDWYGPSAAGWLYAGDDCKVLQRAITSWGIEERPPLYATHLEHLLSVDSSTVSIGELYVTERAGTPLPVVEVAGGLALATPVYYAERRYGTDGRWVVTDRWPVLRYESLAGTAVAVIRLLTPP